MGEGYAPPYEYLNAGDPYITTLMGIERVNKMQIKSPCIITARLLPGIQIGNSFLSIDRVGITHDDRDEYVIYLDTPKKEYTIDDLKSGVGGGSLQKGLESCLSFMGACAESLDYQDRTGKRGENADLFSDEIGAWCQANKNEIDMLQCILSEEENLINED